MVGEEPDTTVPDPLGESIDEGEPDDSPEIVELLSEVATWIGNLDEWQRRSFHKAKDRWASR